MFSVMGTCSGSFQVTRSLVRSRADICSSQAAEDAAEILEAAKTKNWRRVLQMLSEGVDPNVQDSRTRWRLLHYAAAADQGATVDKLLSEAIAPIDICVVMTLIWSGCGYGRPKR